MKLLEMLSIISATILGRAGMFTVGDQSALVVSVSFDGAPINKKNNNENYSKFKLFFRLPEIKC